MIEPRRKNVPRPGCEDIREREGRWCVAGLDTRLRVLTAEEDFFAAFGVPRFELCHRGILQFLQPGFPSCQALSALARTNHGEATGQVVIIRPNGMTLTADVTALALPDTVTSPVRIILAMALVGREGPAVHQPGHPTLTWLEAQVLEGIAVGVPTARLARQVRLSRQGVEYHLGVMLRKLGAANRIALISKAFSAGVLAADTWPPRVDQAFVA